MANTEAFCFSRFCKNPEAVVSLLVPFVEGYTIVNNVSPWGKAKIIEMMITIISNMEK